MFAVCFIKFLMYWNFFALNMPKSSYMFVNRLILINWSPKEGNEWFWKIKIWAICGNLLEMNFFQAFEWLGFQDSDIFCLVFGNCFFYKRHSWWIRQEKPRICNLVKNNLIFVCIFFLLSIGAVGVLFFDLLEKYILFSDVWYWLPMPVRHLETDA